MMKVEKWQQRYPEIGFSLSFFPFEKVELPGDPHPFLDWVQRQNLSEIEVLYIVGLVGFSLPKQLGDWLAERKERALVFIEEKLGAFAVFNREELLQNPQIHFYYAQEKPLAELAELFPTDRLAVYSQGSFDAAGLIRSSAALSALYSDVLYSHKIVENVLANFRHLHGCFDPRGSFKGMPAVICGAGPSLTRAIPTLKEVKEKAFIFAGGSAITALTVQGVQPHFAMALDPNDEEFERLKQAHYFEGPFLFAPRLHKGVFCTANGPFGYLKSDTGGLIENTLEEEWGIQGDPIGPDLGPEAFSVTTLAVAYAYALGCYPIIFAGVDLAYTEGKRYTHGVEAEEIGSDPRALEKRSLRQDIYGEEVETLLKWEMESECIANFVKAHPEIEFLNATEGGLGFKGVKNISLKEALSKAPLRDLQGEIHQWIQFSPLQYKEKSLPSFLETLESSLKRCDELCVGMYQALEEKRGEGSLALYQSDFTEELAYPALLQGIDVALTHILFRYYPHLDPEEGKRERDIAKYRELKRQISKFRAILHQQISPKEAIL